MTTTKEIKNVIIIGGGLAGLTLANSLKLQGIPFVVYERDTSFNCRTQGWSLSLHFALKTLKQCVPQHVYNRLVQDACVSQGVDDRMCMAFRDAETGKNLISMETDPGTSYRIHRGRFRTWLLNQVEDHVYWNKKFARYEEDHATNTVTAFFDDGSEATGDILVGTDGSQSPVAAQLIGKEKFKQITNKMDVRIFGAETWITKEDWAVVTENPVCICVLTGHVKEGYSQVLKHKPITMFCSLQGIDESREKPVQIIWAMSRYDEDRVLPSFVGDEANNAECLALMKAWARAAFPEDSIYRKFVLETAEDTVVTPIFFHERVPELELLQVDKTRVVLVGDAAHPMSMFRGEGGNHAIMDAGNLAKGIGQYNTGEKEWKDVVEEYYTEMIPRGKQAVEESHYAAVMLHTQPEEMIKVYESIGERAAHGRS